MSSIRFVAGCSHPVWEYMGWSRELRLIPWNTTPPPSFFTLQHTFALSLPVSPFFGPACLVFPPLLLNAMCAFVASAFPRCMHVHSPLASALPCVGLGWRVRSFASFGPPLLCDRAPRLSAVPLRSNPILSGNIFLSNFAYPAKFPF